VLPLNAFANKIYATAIANGIRCAVAPVKKGLSDSLDEQLVEITHVETAGG
jgi:hypothetical protein